VLETVRRQGLRVPEDLSVVGYKDIEIAPYLELSTVSVPMRELGRRGVDLLLRTLDEPNAPPEHVRLPGELVVRGTSGAMRA
jgi:LacI family repressor for deo operon, udp, cdd, tsx, nupC, and nupG